MEENVQINEETKGFIATGHFGTWHTVEAKEISGELFYRMEHEEYGDSVASICPSPGLCFPVSHIPLPMPYSQ